MKKETKNLIEDFLKDVGYNPDEDSLCLMVWNKSDDEEVLDLFHPDLDHITKYWIKHPDE